MAMTIDVPIHRTGLDTPIGVLTLIASPRGLQRVLWPEETAPADIPEGCNGMLDIAAEQIHAYFDGTLTTFDVALELAGTPFQLQAWRALARIPYGATVSYTAQAARIGHPSAARAVGAANGRNPVPVVLPCHRVVGADGSLTGFGGGLHVKRALIDLEQRTLRARSSGAPIAV
jgi:methylated-DNA-[protein]-cysteine S-methyltransferase